MSEVDSFSEGEISKLCRKALFIQPAPRRIDLDTVPADGHEYIHKTRLENSSLKFPTLECNAAAAKSPDRKVLNEKIKSWIRTRFCPFASYIKTHRRELIKSYPHTDYLPLHDEVECCLFCLGSELCSSINKSKYPTAVATTKAHLPLLNYIIHLNRSDAIILLTFAYNWFKSIGMTEPIAMWIFAVLACLSKPVTDEEEELLEDIYDDCIGRLKQSKGDESIRLHLISSLLLHYFCVKAYTIGPGF